MTPTRRKRKVDEIHGVIPSGAAFQAERGISRINDLGAFVKDTTTAR
jgi:hypothetical protein